MRGQTPNVVIKIEALMQIKFRVFNLFSRKNNLPPRPYQVQAALFLSTQGSRDKGSIYFRDPLPIYQ